MTVYYLPPSSVIVHLFPPLISPQAVAQYILKLRGQGHNNLPCLLRSFFFPFTLFFFFLILLNFCFHGCEISFVIQYLSDVCCEQVH